ALSGRATAHTRLKRHADALADWDRIVELEPADRRAGPRTSRSLILARLGEHARAAAEVEELARGKVEGGQLYDLACALSICSGATGVGQGPAEGYAAGAVAMLRRAADAGYFREAGR